MKINVIFNGCLYRLGREFRHIYVVVTINITSPPVSVFGHDKLYPPLIVGLVIIAGTVHEDNLISGLKKLASHALSNLTPHPLVVWYRYSHPTLAQRIRAIRSSNNKDNN